MKQPHQYNKKILLAVSGMSPQILTETVYALAHQQPPFIPDEIHLISTTSGAKKANLELLHPKTGKFHALCRDYHLPAIHFNADSIVVITDQDGTPLDDIKTPAQNEAAADFITNVVSRLTRDNDAAVHVSIAGGRKTMGYYLGYALSLYGRAQDRLSHVLVTERYEGLPAFYYPTVESHVIHDRDGHALDAQEAQVMLAEIPFVRLRSGIPNRLLNGETSFNDSIRFAQRFETETKLTIDEQAKQLFANGIEIKLTDINFVFYLWMIKHTVKPEGQEGVIYRSRHELDYAKDFLNFCQLKFPDTDVDKTKDLFDSLDDDKNPIGMNGLWLSDRMTAVKKTFEKALGKTAAQAFVVKKSGTNSRLQYHLSLKKTQLERLR